MINENIKIITFTLIVFAILFENNDQFIKMLYRQ